MKWAKQRQVGYQSRHSDSKNIWFYIWRDKWLYLMLVPVITYYIVFKYVPMYGLIIAFKDYNVFKELPGVNGLVYLTLSRFSRQICSGCPLKTP